MKFCTKHKKSWSLKTEVDKLDIDKLTPVPVDLSKLSNVVKNEVVKKTVCDKIVAKVNNVKGATKLQLENIFVFATKIHENTANFLSSCFSE